MKLKETFQLMGALVLLVFVGASLYSFGSFLFSESPQEKRDRLSLDRKERDAFIYSKPGEHWVINSSYILAFSTPEVARGTKFLIIPKGSTIEILDAQGNPSNKFQHFDVWKEVRVLDLNFKPTAVRGWVQAQMVTRSKNLS